MRVFVQLVGPECRGNLDTESARQCAKSWAIVHECEVHGGAMPALSAAHGAVAVGSSSKGHSCCGGRDVLAVVE